MNISTATPKGDYGIVQMKSVMELFDYESRRMFGTAPLRISSTPTFESLGLANYLVLYEAKFPKNIKNNTDIYLTANAKDRGLIYVDGKLSGIFSRTYGVKSLQLSNAGNNLQVLVESQGHVNYGNKDVEDFKV